MWSVLSLLLVVPCWAGSFCKVELDTPLKGTCDEAAIEENMKDADETLKAEIKAEVACIEEIVKGWTIVATEGLGHTHGSAEPKNSTCSNPEVAAKYGLIRIECAKPVGEFPNSCSGKSVAGEVHFAIAFMAYAKGETKKAKQVLETSLVLGGDHLYSNPNRFVCTGEYSVKEGSCLGINEEQLKDLVPMAPPEPPQAGWMPYPFPMVGYPGTSCDISILEKEGGCDIAAEVDNATAGAENKLIRDCLRECAESYELSWEHNDPWESAVATPSLKTCSQDVADKVCHPVHMQCASVFGEFPNACGGSTLNPKGKIWIAFYAYRREFADRSFRDVLETRAIFGEGATCGWSYKIDKGFCVGLQETEKSMKGPEIDPPNPPALKEMEPLQWPELPSERPEHVEPWVDLHTLLAILLVAGLLALLVVAFLSRRRRLLEEERRLQESREVEIGGVNRF